VNKTESWKLDDSPVLWIDKSVTGMSWWALPMSDSPRA
jgi:hypothetical protein